MMKKYISPIAELVEMQLDENVMVTASDKYADLESEILSNEAELDELEW